MSDAKPQVAAIDGWYSMDAADPHLIGSRCTQCGTYYFPRQSQFCRNPGCDGDTFEDVPLSSRGRVWSYTDACYQPPEPYVAADPFVPFTIAAVELEKEKMIILGQVVSGVGVDQLKVGTPVELVLDTLYSDDESEKLIWKWKPVAA